MLKKYPFNVRVYGLLFDAKDRLLVTDEYDYDRAIIKFPGGGLEYGEGLIDGIKREFMEECNLEIEVISHFYTTDYFQKSAFDDSQIISIYYLISASEAALIQLPTTNKVFDFPELKNGIQTFRWITPKDLDVEDFSFPIDRKVVEMIIQKKILDQIY